MTRLDLTGKVFGRLTAITPQRIKGRTAWECVCSCGNRKTVLTDYLRSGDTRSCGCWEYENQRFGSIKHGHTANKRPSREFLAWAKAKDRCFNPNAKRFCAYGGRGITMCPHWQKSFQNFFTDMGNCPPGYTLDRINVDGNYEPGNCRWATWLEQAKNRQKQVIFNGIKQPLKMVADVTGVKYKSLHYFYRKRQLPIDQAIKMATRASNNHSSNAQFY